MALPSSTEGQIFMRQESLWNDLDQNVNQVHKMLMQSRRDKSPKGACPPIKKQVWQYLGVAEVLRGNKWCKWQEANVSTWETLKGSKAWTALHQKGAGGTGGAPCACCSSVRSTRATFSLTGLWRWELCRVARSPTHLLIPLECLYGGCRQPLGTSETCLSVEVEIDRCKGKEFGSSLDRQQSPR